MKHLFTGILILFFSLALFAQEQQVLMKSYNGVPLHEMLEELLQESESRLYYHHEWISSVKVANARHGEAGV